MNPTDLAAIHAELRHIVHILYVVGALIVVAVGLTCIRTYWLVKRQINQWDLFSLEANDLLEKGEFEKLVQLASAKIRERPNHAYARWYLARALYSQDRFVAAIQEFEETRKLQPEWAVNYVDPYLQEARLKVTSPVKERT